MSSSALENPQAAVQPGGVLQRFRHYIFQRFFKYDLPNLLAPDYPILLDYPVSACCRYGYGKKPHAPLLALFESGRNEFRNRLLRFCALRDSLNQITNEPTSDQEPYWAQDWFSTFDAVALYGMLCEFRPKRLIEVGSGHSTRFARRAIRDHSIETHITSIDPVPRAEIDQLCDAVVRSPLENVDLAIFDDLAPGDILFIDNSHRSFPNSDVTVAFLDILPRLRPGVIVQIHDIFWPLDYPPSWAKRYYSEQYLLGAYLLADAGRDVEILMPNSFVGHDSELAAVCKPLFEIPGVLWTKDPTLAPFGIAAASFWFRRQK